MGFRMAFVARPHIARLLLAALRSIQLSYLERLADRGYQGVRIGHIPVFAGLDPDGTRVTDLAERGGMTRQMMGRLVRELEGLGYVRTRTDPADQRAVIVSLTERGTELHEAASAVITELESEYARLLDDADLDRLRAALTAIIAASPSA
jgi:DNA-binding MarR family transcriptional regulator